MFFFNKIWNSVFNENCYTSKCIAINEYWRHKSRGTKLVRIQTRLNEQERRDYKSLNLHNKMWFKLALKLSGRTHSAIIPLIDFYIELVASINSTGIRFIQCGYVILVLSFKAICSVIVWHCCKPVFCLNSLSHCV